MKKILLLSLLIAFFAFPVSAQEEQLNPDHIPPEDFYLGRVIEIVSEEFQETPDSRILNQVLKVEILTGNEKGNQITVENAGILTVNSALAVKQGQKVVIYRTEVNSEPVYYVADTYRLPGLAWVVALFLILAVALTRLKGLRSILGLAVTIGVISFFVVPQIVKGSNPMLITLISALVISVVSIYLSHGFNKRTSVALASTLITLGLAAFLATVFVDMSRLFGIGSEEAFYLQFGPLEQLNLRGLLLSGIILGVLGVLDDITTAQSATIEEIKKANPALGFAELYKSGFSVGTEHILSLVNTLFLAYAGASLPLFLFFTANSVQPLWVTLNAGRRGQTL